MVSGALAPLQLLGQDNAVLNPNAPLPTLDAATGEFSGPMPPTNGIALGLAAFLPEVLDTGTLLLTINSVSPGATLDARSVTYSISFGSQTFSVPIAQDAFSGEVPGSVGFSALNAIQKKAVVFGGDSTFPIYGSATMTLPGGYRVASWGRGDINGDPSNSVQAGPRWWAGAANENTPKPNELVCTPASGGCVQKDLSRNAGALPGVTTIFHLQSYATVPNAPMRNLEGIGAGLARAADFQVFWGAAGKIDSVHDVTHHVTVPFSSSMGTSWGLITDQSFVAPFGGTPPDGSNTLLTWTDAFCVAPARAFLAHCGSGPSAAMKNTATLGDVAATASGVSGDGLSGAAALIKTGTGFIFYLNGHFFLMQMTALPAAGTVWNARFFAGAITGTGADGDYTFVPAIRPPAVPGLRIQAKFTGTTVDPSKTTEAALAKVHTVPDPYYVTDALEATANTKVLKFVNLPAQAIIRIYSVSGVLVQVLSHNDASGGGEALWNLRNRNNQFVASGVYFWHVETPDGKTKVGRFTVVNFAP